MYVKFKFVKVYYQNYKYKKTVNKILIKLYSKN